MRPIKKPAVRVKKRGGKAAGDEKKQKTQRNDIYIYKVLEHIQTYAGVSARP